MPAGVDPSTRPGSSRAAWSAVPASDTTALAITVGTNGPGARSRPSCSTTTTSSGRPTPDPPCSSRDVEAQPAQVGHGRPGGGHLLGVRLEQGPALTERVVLGQEVGDDLRQRAVVVGDGDRHVELPSQLRPTGATGRGYVVRVGTHHRTCPLCEAMCGLEIETEGDRVVRVRGDRDDVWSKGFLCPKGASLGQLHHDPDRLRAPMVRDGDEWREVTLGRGVRRGARSCCTAVVAEHGIEAVHAYLGNPNVHSYSLSRYSGAVAGLGGITPHVVGRHRRPVAQERGVRPAVRRGVEHPDPRRRQHRPASW